MTRVRATWVVLAVLASHATLAGETCRYTGTASHAGRIEVESSAATSKGETTVDVTARVSARSFGLIEWRYLYQEIGTWRRGELRSVAVNHRYSVAGRIQRQQWDVFNRTAEGMIAFRVQAKTLPDFQAHHPGFVRHWEPASFGQPWLPDYPAAAAQRRADLDLPRAAMAPDLGVPLALAFHWVRWAGQESRKVPVFLPGFKRNARVDVPVAFLGVDGAGSIHLRSTTRHPQLSETEPSVGDAWVTADHRLMRVTFDARGTYGNAQGELRLEGCRGDPSAP
ncbi:MAG: hypothetical protein EXR07_15170 [Acetobacteraceae bacterium]|nr:hypothetical protein [Acetobacteraceae bacterium]